MHALTHRQRTRIPEPAPNVRDIRPLHPTPEHEPARPYDQGNETVGHLTGTDVDELVRHLDNHALYAGDRLAITGLINRIREATHHDLIRITR